VRVLRCPTSVRCVSAGAPALPAALRAAPRRAPRASGLAAYASAADAPAPPPPAAKEKGGKKGGGGGGGGGGAKPAGGKTVEAAVTPKSVDFSRCAAPATSLHTRMHAPCNTPRAQRPSPQTAHARFIAAPEP
jgi:hypothetical protein